LSEQGSGPQLITASSARDGTAHSDSGGR
jgi:hypothetical protein